LGFSLQADRLQPVGRFLYFRDCSPALEIVRVSRMAAYLGASVFIPFGGPRAIPDLLQPVASA
jgi:hypothetical protein